MVRRGNPAIRCGIIDANLNAGFASR